MKVSELIQRLQLLRPDADVSMFEHRYNGGGDESHWTEAKFLASQSLNDLVIVPVEDYTDGMFGMVDLAALDA